MVYSNPEWGIAGGARGSLRLLRFGLDHGGVFLSGEQLWSSDGGRTAAAALVMNAGAVRVGGSFVHDWHRVRNALELTVGSDLAVLLPLLFPRRDPEPVFGALDPRVPVAP